jgi:Peptidase family C25
VLSVQFACSSRAAVVLLSPLMFISAITGCVPNVVPNVQVDSRDEIAAEIAPDSAEIEKPTIEIAVDAPNQVDSPSPSILSRVIAVCPPDFQSALQPWVQRREREGLDVVVIEPSALAEDLKRTLAENNHGRCQYILLVGDAEYSPQTKPTDPGQFIPTVYRNADVSAPYQQASQLPGDYLYGDFDDDGIANAAVGRVPVKSAEQLTGYINRVIAYEDSTDFGRWRSRVDLIAGIGGFGTVIDGAIEMVASGIITGSLPGYVHTRITHASPTSDFHPGADAFTSTVLRNYQEGAKFWVYAGHGWINELDRVPPTQFGRPILAMDDVSSLHRPPSSAPIALMLACYTGAYDLPEDCLAERMLFADQGPIAILAGSRVTMPYGNAAAAIGLIQATYHGRSRRLGDAWLKTLQELATPTANDPELQSRRMMVDGIATVLGGGTRVDDERREHMQLYNWLGDPTLRMAMDQPVEIAAGQDAVVGQAWGLAGTTPIAGSMTIEIHRRLGTAITPSTSTASPYLDANNTVLASQTIQVQKGDWNCEFVDLPSPNVPSGSQPIVIKADVVGTSGFASGSRTAWLRPAAQQPLAASLQTPHRSDRLEGKAGVTQLAE